MNAAHIHIVLNHIPFLGLVACLVLLAAARWRRSEELKSAALLGFVLAALVALPVYLTGEPAEDLIPKQAAVSEQSVERHEDAATAALVGLEAVGALSLLALLTRRRALIAGRLVVAAAVLACGTATWTAWTANLGGQIRHPEIGAIGAGGEATAVADHESRERH
jgi:hypothetical protein